MLHIASLLRLLCFFSSRCKAKYVTRSVSIISVRLREKISTKLLIRIFFVLGIRGVMVPLPTGERDLCLIHSVLTASGPSHSLPGTLYVG